MGIKSIEAFETMIKNEIPSKFLQLAPAQGL
ncbi:hypothetical protein CEJ86_33970, partial [Sinorhizobium meliloti]